MPRADQRMVVAATAAVLAWLQTAALLTLGAEITIAPTRAACPGGSASPKHMVVVNAGGVPASLHYSWAACNDPAMGGKGHSTEQASANAHFDGCVCVCVYVGREGGEVWWWTGGGGVCARARSHARVCVEGEEEETTQMRRMGEGRRGERPQVHALRCTLATAARVCRSSGNPRLTCRCGDLAAEPDQRVQARGRGDLDRPREMQARLP